MNIVATTVEEFPGYTEVAEFGEWDYSWSIMKVYKENRSGRLFGLTDSGCSCVRWGDGWGHDLDKGIGEMVELPNLKAGLSLYETIYSSHHSMDRPSGVVEKLIELGLR